MIRKKHEGIKWLEFELLQEFSRLSHGSFLRHGGVSKGAFASLNTTASSGDDKTHVEENRARLMKFFPGKKLVASQQVHGDLIVDVTGKLPEGGCDALFTESKEHALMIQHADCQAAIFYDPIHHRLANVHSGWRGSVQNIYKKTVELFKAKGSNPADIFVCISPSLGPNFAEFMHYEKELSPFFHDFKGKNLLFDFWQASREQLKLEGILPSHIQISEICTHENKEDFFSYRRDKLTGRHATIAALH